MAKAKRKSKAAKSRKPGNKVKKIKALKKRSAVARAKARPAAKPRRAPKAAPAAKKKAHAGKPAAKPHAAPKATAKADDKAKKPAIKSAKAALEQLEAKLAEGLKSKAARGRPGRKSKKEEWLAAMAVLPKEDAETRRMRLKTLIKLGKDRGFQ